MNISETGNLQLLLKRGKATDDTCLYHWESIINKNEKSNGSYGMMTYVELMQSYLQLLNEMNFVQAALLKLSIKWDEELADELILMGYQINKNSSVEFAECFSGVVTRSRNLISQVMSKKKEIEEFSKSEGGGQAASFEDIIAITSLQIGFQISDKVTLAQYNSYRKAIKQKSQEQKKVKDYERDPA